MMRDWCQRLWYWKAEKGKSLFYIWIIKHTPSTHFFNICLALFRSQENDISGHRLTKFIERRADEAKVTKEWRFGEAKWVQVFSSDVWNRIAPPVLCKVQYLSWGHITPAYLIFNVEILQVVKGAVIHLAFWVVFLQCLHRRLKQLKRCSWGTRNCSAAPGGGCVSDRAPDAAASHVGSPRPPPLDKTLQKWLNTFIGGLLKGNAQLKRNSTAQYLAVGFHVSLDHIS